MTTTETNKHGNVKRLYIILAVLQTPYVLIAIGPHWMGGAFKDWTILSALIFCPYGMFVVGCALFYQGKKIHILAGLASILIAIGYVWFLIWAFISGFQNANRVK